MSPVSGRHINVSFRQNYHAEEFNFIKENSKLEIKVPVTGAYTLADWSYDEHYKSKDELVLALARNVVRPLVKDLVGLGAKIIQIDEPAATTHPAEMDIFRESINESVKGIDAKFVVHACFSGNDYKALAPQMPEIKAEQYTLEFANRDTWNTGLDDDARKGFQVLNFSRNMGLRARLELESLTFM